MAFAAALCVVSAPTVFAGPEAAKELAKQPGVILARELLDVPGKNLVVVALEFPLNRTRNRSHLRNTLGIAIRDRRMSM
jgi:hypothetical protein